MNKVTAHRGPDGTGVFCEDGVTLGHNRLSIIDLSENAAQPMMSADGNLIITYNGELYNFKDIKKELSDYQFKTESDTEVILASYRRWGSNCVTKFDGIFAFAIWDKSKWELFLARDQSGVKPLYYYFQAPSTGSGQVGKFIFSSEIKAILEHNLSRKLDRTSFGHYMRLLYTPAPFTIFSGINKLKPAHFALLKSGNLEIVQYWQPKIEKTKLSYSDARAQARECVLGSVHRQLVSDRPLGVYLSGGIDSSVITAAMKAVRNDIDTFSVGFDLTESEQSEKFNADFLQARATAKYFGTKHHEIMMKSESLPELLEQTIWHLDEPVSNATIMPMLELSKFAKEYVTVVLSGDGGDELFGGYPRYQKSRLLDYSPVTIPLDRRIERFMFQKDNVLSRILNPEYFELNKTREFFKENFPALGNLTQAFMNTDRQSWLVDEALLRSDKMSMANAVEARVPLLSPQLIELANSLPISWKVSLFDTKKILKDAFARDLPESVLRGKKRGFFSPASKWLRRPDFLSYVREVLSPNYYPTTSPLFNWPGIISMLGEHLSGGYYLNPLWSVLTFQIWAKRFKINL